MRTLKIKNCGECPFNKIEIGYYNEMDDICGHPYVQEDSEYGYVMVYYEKKIHKDCPLRQQVIMIGLEDYDWSKM